MKIGKLNIYSYKVKRIKKRFINYTDHEFYGQNRLFRWNIFIFGKVIDINYHTLFKSCIKKQNIYI